MTSHSLRFLRWEIALVLAVTFGTSGLRSIVRLADATLNPLPLSSQSTTLNVRQSSTVWIDPLLQLLSSGVLFAWGGLAVFLLLTHQSERKPLLYTRWRYQHSDWLHGVFLAGIIGLPGLVFYICAVRWGFSKVVIPSGLDDYWWNLPLLIVNSWANGFAEEIIVVVWLGTRLSQIGWGRKRILAASAGLRASYHLYQGFSAGVGNMFMGIVYFEYWRRTGRIWPLVVAHGLIDSVAFIGYTFLGSPV